MPTTSVSKAQKRRRLWQGIVPSVTPCLLATLPFAFAEHHMKRIAPRQNGGGNSIPIQVQNSCTDTIYPGFLTQSGQGPSNTGFELSSGASNNQSVSSDWQGRVWGRTNCSFNNGGGQACQTGDCGSGMSCQGAGNTPVTLAEFTLNAGDGQTYYDISLVDGYNLPMAIVLLSNGNSKLDDIPPNQLNPSCVGSVGDLNEDQQYSPYNSGSDFLGTNSSFPLPFDTKVTQSQVSNWCPWDLQKNPPTAPGDGVYPYPDSNVQRPVFDPCLSACAKYNDDKDCCNGGYNSPQACQPNFYSQAAKGVCPDAYSYAYDDQSSTFVVPQGAGFQVVFCPGGRSTNIKSQGNNGGNQASKLSQGYIGNIKKSGAVRAWAPSRGVMVGAVLSFIATAGLFSSL